MKVLYITLNRKRKDPSSSEDAFIDFGEISRIVREGISERFENAEISIPLDIINDDGYIPHEILEDYNLFICDISLSVPQVHFLSGMVEGLGKPIIYICNNDHKPIKDIAYKTVIKYSEASLKNEFKKELNALIGEALQDPGKFALKKAQKVLQPKAFISYSHKDKDYLSRLLVHLKPLERNRLIDVWKDTDIGMGDKWREEIEQALANANIAILLISADFMASDFIVENELPPLLANAEVKGTKIVPVILSPCRFSREPLLNRFQAANPPNNPLSQMSKADQEAVYDSVAADIEAALGRN